MAESKNPKFDRAFAAARKKFKKTGDANDYTFYFKGEGREGRFTVNQKGETKKDLMAKFAPGSKNTGANYQVKGKDKVRPKLRPKSTESGELNAGQIAAQELVYKKSGGKLGGNPEVKRKMAKFKADGTVAGAAQKARPGARANTPKVKAKAVQLEVFTDKRPPSVIKLEAFKNGTLKLSQREAFRLIKSLKRYNKKNLKDKVIIPLKLIKLGAM